MEPTGASLTVDESQNLVIHTGGEAITVPKAGRLARGQTVTVMAADQEGNIVPVQIRVSELVKKLSLVGLRTFDRPIAAKHLKSQDEEALKDLGKRFSSLIEAVKLQHLTKTGERDKVTALVVELSKALSTKPEKLAGMRLSLANLVNREGQTLSGTPYRVDGQEVGIESSTRMETVDCLINAYKAEMAYCEQEEASLKAELARCTSPNPKQSTTSRTTPTEKRESSQERVSTEEYLQARLKKVKGRLGQLELRLDEAETRKAAGLSWIASERYRKDVAMEDPPTYVPALVNARTHQVKLSKTGEIVPFQRFGAITDPRDGSTNLEQLERLKRAEVLLKKIEAQNRNEPKPLPQGGQAALELITAGVKKGLSDESIAKMIIEAMNPREVTKLKKPYTLEQLEEYYGSEKIKGTELENAYEKRKSCLEAQMLQVLMLHVQSNGESIRKNDTGTMAIGQVSLLNPKKKKTYKGGFIQNEFNQIKDMEKIFELFNGKTLIFDGTGPFIDIDGRVHLPEKIVDDQGKPKELTLSTLFFNVSTKGSAKQRAGQATVNHKALDKLQGHVDGLEKTNPALSAQLRTRLEEIRKRLIEDSSDEIAADIAQLMKDAGLAVGVNCFSAKDRTARVMALLVSGALRKGLTTWTNLYDGIDVGAVMRRFGEQIWDKRGVSRQITHQNTRSTIVKTDRWFILGMTALQSISNLGAVAAGWVGKKLHISHGIED